MGLHRVSGFCARVGRRIRHELQYLSRKAVYLACSTGGINQNKIFEKHVKKYFRDEPLNVFLNRSLMEIDLEIESDAVLKERIVSEGALVMQHTLLVLNEHRPDMYDLQSGHYRWTEDFFTGYQYPNCFYMDVRKKETLPNTDIKIPWEIARMQFLFALALSYRATKDDTYAKRITEIIRDFCICCPYDKGVNWNVSMEVGIRIANILLACELIQDAPCFDLEFKLFLAVTVYQHMLHIRRNLENPRDGNNHLIADLLGLAAASTALRFLPVTKRYASYTQKLLRRELMRQVLPDGGHFEGSVSYHRLVGEMICFAVSAQKKYGFSLTEEENERLAKMGEFTAGLRMGNGLVPQLGDTDSGRVFQLAPENTRDHDSFVNLVSFITRKAVVYPEKTDGFFVFYNTDIPQRTDLYEQKRVKEFPQFKVLLYRDRDVFLAFCGMTPEKFGKAGHSHNDVLSFILSIDEDEFITDPGSGEYTGNTEIGFATRSIHKHSSISIDSREQRLPPIDKRAFIWNTFVQSSLKWENRDDGKICFSGECTYSGKDNNNVKQQRQITISPTMITIEDHLQGMKEECTMALPVFPGIDIVNEEGCVALTGKKHKINVSGSYEFSIHQSLFAMQYKSVMSSQLIQCHSNSNHNTLCIEWLN